MNKPEINNGIPNSFSEMVVGVVYYVLGYREKLDGEFVVDVLNENGFSECFVDHPPYTEHVHVGFYINNEGKKLYRYYYTRSQKNTIPHKVVMAAQQFFAHFTEPKEIDHEANDLCEATHTQCDYTPAIQATANKLINHGYTDIGEGDCEHTNLYINHKEKTFYTK